MQSRQKGLMIKCNIFGNINLNKILIRIYERCGCVFGNGMMKDGLSVILNT